MSDVRNQPGTYQKAFAAFGVDPVQHRSNVAAYDAQDKSAAQAPFGNIVQVDFVNKRVVQRLPQTQRMTFSQPDIASDAASPNLPSPTNLASVTGSNMLPSSAFQPPVDVDDRPTDQKVARHAPSFDVPFQPGPQGPSL